MFKKSVFLFVLVAMMFGTFGFAAPVNAQSGYTGCWSNYAGKEFPAGTQHSSGTYCLNGSWTVSYGSFVAQTGLTPEQVLNGQTSNQPTVPSNPQPAAPVVQPTKSPAVAPVSSNILSGQPGHWEAKQVWWWTEYVWVWDNPYLKKNCGPMQAGTGVSFSECNFEKYKKGGRYPMMALTTIALTLDPIPGDEVIAVIVMAAGGYELLVAQTYMMENPDKVQAAIEAGMANIPAALTAAASNPCGGLQNGAQIDGVMPVVPSACAHLDDDATKGRSVLRKDSAKAMYDNRKNLDTKNMKECYSRAPGQPVYKDGVPTGKFSTEAVIIKYDFTFPNSQYPARKPYVGAAFLHNVGDINFSTFFEIHSGQTTQKEIRDRNFDWANPLPATDPKCQAALKYLLGYLEAAADKEGWGD